MSKQNFIYIIKILFTMLLLCFVLDKIIYFTLNKISDKVYTGMAIGKLNQYLSIKDSANLLIFGSSRANHNIDSKLLDSSSYNMGVDGTNIAYSTILIKLLNNKQQTLLVQIDPNFLYDKTYKGNDVLPLLIKYNRNEIIKNEIIRLKLNNPFQNFFWSISYNNCVLAIITNFIKPKYNYKTYYGYDPIDVSLEQRIIFEKILNQKKEIICQDTFSINKIFYNYLMDLKKFANANNKKLIFFTAPIYKDECKLDNTYFSTFAQQSNLLYYDYSDFFNSNNSLSFWKDEIHLSRIGAEIFTKKIKNDIIETIKH